METITELIRQAQVLGVRIYPQNGQIKVDVQWPINEAPDPIRLILCELKQRKEEALAYFATTETGSTFSMACREYYETGICRIFELDCELYPTTLMGTRLCRKRAKALHTSGGGLKK